MKPSRLELGVWLAVAAAAALCGSLVAGLTAAFAPGGAVGASLLLGALWGGLLGLGAGIIGLGMDFRSSRDERSKPKHRQSFSSSSNRYTVILT